MSYCPREQAMVGVLELARPGLLMRHREQALCEAWCPSRQSGLLLALMKALEDPQRPSAQ